MKTILITGAAGMFGSEACQLFKQWGYEVIGAKKSDVDVTSLNQVEEFFFKKDQEGIKIDFVIHAAAYTKVDDAETNKELAFLINAKSAKILALVTKKRSIPLLYISTDYVFDGQKKSAYFPYNKTNPINVYGASKLLGEENVRSRNPQHYITRTSWLYGKNGKNFVDTMLAIAKNQRQIKVVSDQFGCPTSVYDLAFGIRKLIEEKMIFGTYHLCGSGFTSWYEFAKKVFEIRKIDVLVIPVKSEEFSRLAKRPKFSAMDNGGLLRSWQEALAEYLST